MSHTPTDPATAAPFLALLRAPEHGAGNLPDSLKTLREAGRARFAATGLPTAKNELWRFTSLNPLLKLTLTADIDAGGGVVDALPRVRADGRPAVRLVVVNGRYRPDLSNLDAMPKDCGVLTGLAEALAVSPDQCALAIGAMGGVDSDPLTALNTAGLEDGACVLVGEGVDLAPLVEVVHVAVAGENAAPFSQPRLLIILAPNARATVVEHQVSAGLGASVTNQVTEIALAPGARLRHYIAQRVSDQAVHFSTTKATVMAGAAYDSFALNLGGRLARHDIHVNLTGSGASCTLDGAYMVAGNQHTDTTTRIEHTVPNTTSREVYKGTIDGSARGVFQGKILVKPGAVKTDGHQLHRALLLSDQAGVDAKPELEIYADDVKCSHGATCGELDDAALFFLRARGIPKDTARALLISAFLAEAVDTIADADVRATFAALVEGRLARTAHAGDDHAAGN